ncbi:YceD family protein, partial [Listeria monocytogenes]|uniref:YceD family protein n=1 Tax=Listeria monocytogenes TaxID=1639 RepID=UPI003B4381D2
MKWSISQLKKYRDSNFTINEKADLKKFFQENNIDVRDASPVQVTGELIVHPEEVTANLTMRGEWTLTSARTLEEVIYPYEVHATETFVKSKEQVLDESWHVMEQDMVDLNPVVAEILRVEIPMQDLSKNEHEIINLQL